MTMRHALTTVDNPYDPFLRFREWLEYDRASGYDTPNYLGRVVITSDDLSDADQAEAVSIAIDEILSEHGDTLYKKVSRDDADLSAADIS
jgi:hypothetical protein